MRIKQALKAVVVVVGVIIGGLVFLLAGNNLIKVSRYEVVLEGLSEEMDGLRIVHISDIHGKEFGLNNRRLARVIEGENPDFIFVSGDMIDSRDDDGSAFIDLLHQLAGRYPIYCSLGNHEQIVDITETELYNDFARRVREAGCILLDNERVEISRGGTPIAVYGFTSMLYHYTGSNTAEWEGAALGADFIEEKLGRPAEGEIAVLLAHNPKYFREYARWGADLIFAGHVHGGVVRLPFAGGIFSPDLTFFPEYSAGLYTLGTAKMHVSTGLGNSVVPFRLFNRPEVSLIVLKSRHL